MECSYAPSTADEKKSVDGSLPMLPGTYTGHQLLVREQPTSGYVMNEATRGLTRA